METSTINFLSKTDTGYKTKLGEISNSDVLEINEDNQLVISNELFETLYSQKESKKISLRDASSNYHLNKNERYIHTSKRFERY